MKESVEKLVGSFEGRVGGTDELGVEQIEESVGKQFEELMGGAVGGVGGTQASIDSDVVRKFN